VQYGKFCSDFASKGTVNDRKLNRAPKAKRSRWEPTLHGMCVGRGYKGGELNGSTYLNLLGEFRSREPVVKAHETEFEEVLIREV
jgi:hypothetical protein